MGRVLLFAMIGGALAVLAWLALRSWLARHRAEARLRELAARAAEREAEARLEPGGHPANPIEVVSPAVVEPKAGAMPCPACGGEVRVLEHQARTIGGQRLRIAVVECERCGLTRAIYFKLQTPPS